MQARKQGFGDSDPFGKPSQASANLPPPITRRAGRPSSPGRGLNQKNW